MKEGLPGGRLRLSSRSELEEARFRVARWVGLSRKRLDVCLLSEGGQVVEEFAAPPDRDGLRGLARRVGRHGLPVRGVVESMTGARFVHDTLEGLGWDVLIANAERAKGLVPLACKTDRIDARVLAVLSERDLVPEIWLPRDGPLEFAPPEPASHFAWSSRRGGDREMSAAPTTDRARAP